MRLAWATDIHLNFVSDDEIADFCRVLQARRPDAVLLTGDIGEADSIDYLLARLAHDIDLPIYFVLGNHDYYHGDMDGVRERVAALTQSVSHLTWLTRAGVCPLTEQTALVGHDGWADGRLGLGRYSSVWLNDYVLIRDLVGLPVDELYVRLAELGDTAARQAGQHLTAALERFTHIVFVTHVPPFREACWHKGHVSSDDWLPHFTCQAMGDVLRRAMEARPEQDLKVLCGHTHGEGSVDILPNLRVLTGGATYGRPEWQPEVTVP